MTKKNTTTKEAVEIITDLYMQTGTLPSYEEVMLAADGCSKTTVSKAMKEWEKTNAELLQARNKLPKEVEETALTAISNIWKVADNIAEQKVLQKDEELASVKDKFARINAKALNDIQSRDKRISELSKMGTHFDQLQKEHLVLAAKAESKEEKITFLEAEIANLRAQNDKLKDELLKIAKAG